MVSFANVLKDNDYQVVVLAPASKYTWLDEHRFKSLKNLEIIRLPVPLINNHLLAKLVSVLVPLDAYIFWAIRAYITVLNERSLHPDVVLTSGPPHSMHLVGLLLKRKLGIKWISDYRDHFTLSPEYHRKIVFKYLVDRYIEGKFLKHSDRVVLNTNTNREDVLRIFKLKDTGKVNVIYNGFDLAERNCSKQSPIAIDHLKLNLIYSGGMRGDKIDGYFYRVVAGAIAREPNLIQKLRIHVVGDSSRVGNDLFRLGLGDIIHFHDPVSYDNIGNVLMDFKGGVIWQRPNIRYRGTVPGKLYDYLGYGLPVFSLDQKDSEISKILKTYNIGVSVDVEKYELCISEFLSFLGKSEKGEYRYNSNDRKRIQADFSRSGQSIEFLSLIQSLKLKKP
jgi:hypothetical protein